jgi:hypothetical protein
LGVIGADFGEREEDWGLIVDFGSEAISIKSMGIELWLDWGNQA